MANNVGSDELVLSAVEGSDPLAGRVSHAASLILAPLRRESSPYNEK